MKGAIESLGRQFTQNRPGVMLRYNFGSSGELQKQIEAGAPVDLFISAAQRQMDELESKGLIIGPTRRVFARNVLTVIKPADSKLDLSKPADLLAGRVQKIVIGNPKTVPVGQYSEESLRALGLWNQVQPKLVLAENVRQALDYVTRGEVDAGFVYTTDAAARPGTGVVAIPPAAAAAARVVVAPRGAALEHIGVVAVAMALGGMIVAHSGSRWLARVSESDLRRIVRGLLVFIGMLLVIEVVVAWPSPGLPLGDLGRMALGVVAGIVIGAVSSLLGVAGGELIIPTLMFVFGADIRTAGTLSLLISMPSVLVGLASQRAQLVAAGRQDLTRVVVPLGVGSVVGAIVGATLVAHVPGAAVKVLLRPVLIVSALKLFGVESHVSESGRPMA